MRFTVIAKGEEPDNKLFNDLLAEIKNEDSAFNDNSYEEKFFFAYKSSAWTHILFWNLIKKNQSI